MMTFYSLPSADGLDAVHPPSADVSRAPGLASLERPADVQDHRPSPFAARHERVCRLSRTPADGPGPPPSRPRTANSP